jgi:hypothetical protein
MTAAVSRRVDDEGLPPPPVHGKAARWPLRTIVGRLEGGGFQLQPFLVIGIISATRDILTVGAELSVALVLVRRFARLDHA